MIPWRGMTPSQLRARAAALEEEAVAIVATDLQRARDLNATAEGLRILAEETELASGLRRSDRSGNSTEKMQSAARVRHSVGTSDARDDQDVNVVRFQEIANAAGHTIRSVAEALKKKRGKGTHVYILKALRGGAGIRRTWADDIQELTKSLKYPHGFVASQRNWPGGWSRE